MAAKIPPRLNFCTIYPQVSQRDYVVHFCDRKFWTGRKGVNYTEYTLTLMAGLFGK